MILIVFAVIAIIGQVLNVLFCLAIETLLSSDSIGALIFVALYLLVFGGAWKLSVYIVERIQGQSAEQPLPVQHREQPQQRPLTHVRAQ